MKYKRQFMMGMLALALWTGSPAVYAEDMSISTTKVEQYGNQLRMKSHSSEVKVEKKNKKIGIKRKVY